MQQLPASPDAFVWLRLYQQQVHGLVPSGPDDPLWWTLRRPFRPLGYHAARAMFVRANAAVGSGWTLHDLRHTAAYRLARDPAVPITDVQWILGHQSLSTTQIYVTPTAEDVIAERPGPSPAGRAAGVAAGASAGDATARRAWTSCSAGSGRDRRRRGEDGRAPVAAQRGGAGAVGEVPAAHRSRPAGRRPASPGARSWPGCSRRRSLAETSQDRCNRKLALLKVLDWLELHPGRTWQERWDASGAGDDGRRDWRRTAPGRAGRRREPRAAGRADLQASSAWAWPS